MELVEFYRMRFSLGLYGALGVVLIVLTNLVGHGTVRVNGQDIFPSGGLRLDVTFIAPVAMFFAAMFASSAALALNRERVTLELAWTKPLARPFLALRYIAVDLVAIVVAYAYAMLVAVIMLAHYGVQVFVVPSFAVTTLLALGVTMMWYGLLLALSCAFTPRMSWIVGVSWPVAFIVMGLGINRDGTIGTILRALNVITPFAYLSGMSSGTTDGGIITGRLTSIWQYAPETRTAIVWSFAVLFSALAVTIWSTREV